jgi:hypothetical protein
VDPDANLNEQRELCRKIMRATGKEMSMVQDAERLAELASSLDDWMTNGGFLPASWRPTCRGCGGLDCPPDSCLYGKRSG